MTVIRWPISGVFNNLFTKKFLYLKTELYFCAKNMENKVYSYQTF
jgi:hypothetical protein